MSVRPFLLRLLVSATLILNGGSGWAMPPGQSAAGAADTIEAQVPLTHSTVDAAAPMPCHEDVEHGAADASVHSPALSTDIADPGASGSTDDCCESGVCDCGCLHHSGLAFAAQFFRARDTHDPQSPVVFAQTHAAPMLPHLIRPPIG